MEIFFLIQPQNLTISKKNNNRTCSLPYAGHNSK
jgi:hypothetical protein